MALLDHFHFLNTAQEKSGVKATKEKPPASKAQAALQAGWFLGTTDKWVGPYYDPADLHSVDRKLFA